eukprot:TRINITY_DN14126_c0_g1_i1.p2 TRINITY_DN14126_c0_g1~~TRINITY_DN14126_c0_g1_i1.p2  ORF type:complete len:120 (-),score=7.15 TRINITY_DN14126_c0_g1_i1:633-992(-)
MVKKLVFWPLNVHLGLSFLSSLESSSATGALGVMAVNARIPPGVLEVLQRTFDADYGGIRLGSAVNVERPSPPLWQKSASREPKCARPSVERSFFLRIVESRQIGLRAKITDRSQVCGQ